jgi:hypothetical protein
LFNQTNYRCQPSSLGTLHYLGPVLHNPLDDLASLDDVDEQVAAWRDAVKDGSARAGAWPRSINIPSKIGQVSAVRTPPGNDMSRTPIGASCRRLCVPG